MIINTFSQVIVSPLLSKLVLLLCSGVLFRSLRRKDTEGQSGYFIALITFLAAKDAFLALVPMPELAFLFDILYFGSVAFQIGRAHV